MTRTTDQRKASWTPERRANVSEKVRARVAKRKAEFVIPERKICRVCKTEKLLADFPAHPTMKDGHLNHCQECINTKTRARNATRPRKKRRFKRVLHAQFLASLPADFKLKCRGCGIEKPLTEFHKTKFGKYRVRRSCMECLAKKFQELSPEKKAEHYARSNQWMADHPAVSRANGAKRRAAEFNARPKWLTFVHEAQIQAFHEIAIARNMQTGLKHHVDHVIPLRNKKVCGLHVPWNLQVLTNSENSRKHNRLLEEHV